MQNSVERLTENIHQVAYSFFIYLTPRGSQANLVAKAPLRMRCVVRLAADAHSGAVVIPFFVATRTLLWSLGTTFTATPHMGQMGQAHALI
jgi:hypothetical protein